MNDVNMVFAAPDLGLKDRRPAAWETEHQAFRRLLLGPLATHEGQYVAVRQGRIIAEGLDQIEVAKQAYAQVGYVPIQVGLVSIEPAPPARVPSPRLLRSVSL